MMVDHPVLLSDQRFVEQVQVSVAAGVSVYV